MKEEHYKLLVSQIASLIDSERDMIAVMSNVAAAIHQTMGFWWTGFYRVVGDELVLGPFQGPVACMHIPYGKGVCGTVWQRAKTIIVPGKVMAVLDIDSERLATFDDIDRKYLEEICKLMEFNCH